MLRTVRINFLGIDFDIVDRPDMPTYFLFGVRKSGSSIMNSMVESLARMNCFNYIDIPGRLFFSGMVLSAWQRNSDLACLLKGGNVYGGFRNAPLGLIGHSALEKSRQILLVRDPRDALVSEYFSNAYSHSIPQSGEAREYMLAERAAARGTAIDSYVIQKAPAFRDTLREYIPFLANPLLRLYHYERAILDKRWFLQDICEHFGWQVSQSQIGLILQWADVKPEKEQPTAFVRKVIPGDHQEKLSPDIIEQLNDIFADEMRLFGYSP